jgi:hypothetical protein
MDHATSTQPIQQDEQNFRADDDGLAPILTEVTAAELPDPPLGAPTLEKDNPLSLHSTVETSDLSQRTTASTDVASGETLHREVPHPSTDAIPASKQTTASTEGGEPLELIDSVDPVQAGGEKVGIEETSATPQVANELDK